MEPEITEKLSELKKHNYILWLRSRGGGMTYLTCKICGVTYLTNEYLKYINDETSIK